VKKDLVHMIKSLVHVKKDLVHVQTGIVHTMPDHVHASKRVVHEKSDLVRTARDGMRGAWKRTSPSLPPEGEQLRLIRLHHLGERQMIRRVQHGAVLEDLPGDREHPAGARADSRLPLLFPPAR
jgi:hypothetical protein